MALWSMARRTGHYTLYAFVCGQGCVARSDVDGTISFKAIINKRPSECRYAVVGEWDVVSHEERIIVWDLFDTKMRGATKLLPPKPLRIYNDVDQAIMATMLLYEND